VTTELTRNGIVPTAVAITTAATIVSTAESSLHKSWVKYLEKASRIPSLGARNNLDIIPISSSRGALGAKGPYVSELTILAKTASLTAV
jgi:hypothetical protein